MSEITRDERPAQHGYEGLPWFDRVWVVLLVMVVLTASWRVIV